MAVVTILNRTDSDGESPRVESSPATSILNALVGAGVRIRHDCGGKALCGTCAMRVVRGGAGLSPIGPKEAERLAGAGHRLACQAYSIRDVDIELIND
jgi:ferredoxin